MERALPTARTAVTEAESRYNAAEAAAEGANETAAADLATAFIGGKTPGRVSLAATARAELAAATRIVARNAKTILDGKIAGARSSMGFTNDKCRKAALAVIVAERLDDVLADAAEARAKYLESVGQLAWLLKTHLIPDGDARARQLVSGADTAPAMWPEAKAAGIAAMEDALAALMADAEAVI